ncbi:MAG: sigma-70 family RNA polymerase sigma factor [Pseudomonadota bacterium]|nr:sigma-70 family RNA polymerase sigma factor [Pseudomonadota bacterium]
MAENSPQKRSLEELMHAAQRGDGPAYAQLLREITPLIKGFLYNRLGDNAENDDLVQETLLAVHKASHTYNTDRPFKAWMFAIADHKLKDYLRSHYQKAALIKVDFAEIEHSLTDNVTDTPSAGELLDEILETLPDKQRRIVRMMKIDGYSVEQVALAMNMSPSAVKVSAHRAYKLLIERRKKEAS